MTGKGWPKAQRPCAAAAKAANGWGRGLDNGTDRAREEIAQRYGEGPVAAKIRAHIATATF